MGDYSQLVGEARPNYRTPTKLNIIAANLSLAGIDQVGIPTLEMVGVRWLGQALFTPAKSLRAAPAGRHCYQSAELVFLI